MRPIPKNHLALGAYMTLSYIALLCGARNTTAETELEQRLKATTQKTYATNCSSLVDQIRKDSRLRLSILGYSIEQISSRAELFISPSKVYCKGEALFSTSERARIYYGATKDEYGEWIIEYSRTNPKLGY